MLKIAVRTLALSVDDREEIVGDFIRAGLLPNTRPATTKPWHLIEVEWRAEGIAQLSTLLDAIGHEVAERTTIKITGAWNIV